jgi:uncharacterized membrane protein YfcA
MQEEGWAVEEGSGKAMFFAELLLFGVSIGMVSGLLGAGGGILLVPGLIALFGFSQQEAQGTSIAAMIPPIGIFAAMVYYKQGHVRVPIATCVALGFMGGLYLGARLIPFVAVNWLQWAFGGLLVYLGLAFLFGNQLPWGVPSDIAGLCTLVAGWLRVQAAPSRSGGVHDGADYQI